MSSPKEVADFMLQELKQQKYLYQDVIVTEIFSKYGEDFTHINDNGNLAINRDVLKEFRKLTEKDVVWERSERMWRMRESSDEARRQVE